MGGIGKTTIADAVCKRIANQFDAVCSLENVRNDATNGPNHLQKKLLSRILGEGNHYMNDFMIRRLRCLKILIVIDDVDDSKHLKELVGDRSLFGPGSRIIVTSRDRQVLKNGVDKLYEVEGLNDYEAPQLFSLNAFKQIHSLEDRMELSSKFVHYAKGNPLALKVLGCSLFEKSMEEWESSLDNLKKSPDSDILDVLRVSYDRLDYPEKEIFLFIACFFKGEERDRVTTILNGCGFSALIVISGLVDKCLVTITCDNRLSMHDLIQEMGRDVVFKESVKKPGKRSRLWDPQEICDLFKKNTGTEAVESISLDLSQISELYISPDAFTRMPNLKLLKFYFSTLYDWHTTSHDWSTTSHDWRYYKWLKDMNKVKIICEELKSLPDELRYVSWPGYPLKYLPFNPEHLVDLEMPFSKLQHIWKDTKFLGKKMRRIDLSECRQLTEVMYLSQAKNLESMELGFCSSLTKFPNISYNVTLTRLCMDGTAIENVPSMRHLTSLNELSLRGCSNITEFPEISGAITYLDLSETAVEEVPDSAIKSLIKIVKLDMSYNTRLRNLPSMRHLTSLGYLFLKGCSNITEFPDVSEEIGSLNLSGTGIEVLPSFVGRLTKLGFLSLDHCKRLKKVSNCIFQLKSVYEIRLEGCSKLENFSEVLENEGMLPSSIEFLSENSELSMRYCKNLESLPNSLCNQTNLSGLYLSGCPAVKKMLENVLSSSPSGLCSLYRLDLSECNLEVLPSALSRLSSLNWLNLRGNEFESLNLELVPSLRSLEISDCKRLKCLQAFPHLEFIFASNCTSLETLPDINAVSREICYYDYYNCFKLDESTRLKTVAWLRTQIKDSDTSSSLCILSHSYPTGNVSFWEEGSASFCFPGSKIPEWFINQNQSSSIEIDLPPHWYSDKFVGFVVCIVASCESSNHIDYSEVKCECEIKDPDCDWQDLTFYFPATLIKHPKSDHMFIKSIRPDKVFVDRKSDGERFRMTDPRFNTENSSSWQKARFRFSTSNVEKESDSCCKVKKCGINLVYSEREDQVFETESEEENCHSEREDQVFETESEEEDCHSESEEEDCHSEREDQVFETVMMSPQRKKRKITT